MKKFYSRSSKNYWISIVSVLFSVSFLFSQNEKKENEFKPSGKVWGYMFGDFFYKADGLAEAGPDSFTVAKGDTLVKIKRWGDTEFAKVPKNFYAFTFRRIYLGYDYQFTPQISSRILLESNDGILTPGGDRTVFIKLLNLEWKNILPNQTLKLGQIGTPTWQTFVEPQWGYRSVEKTIFDMRRIGRSNDVGIGISGIVLDRKTRSSDSAGISKQVLNISYNAVWGNGMASKPENNSLKVFYGEIIFKFLGCISLEGYGEYDYSDNVYPSGANKGKKYSTAKSIYRGFLGYENEYFAGGIESIKQFQENVKIAAIDSATDIKKDTSLLTQTGLSLWAKGTIIKEKLFVFVRHDFFNSDAGRRGWEYYRQDNDARRYNEKFYLIGVDWRPARNIQVMPNLWINSYKDMSSNEIDFRATGSKEFLTKSVNRKADIVARITLFYKF